jgi:hypothetical protein
MYIIAQVIGFVGFIITLIAYHRKTKEAIFKNMIVANTMDILHYLLLGAYTGCLTKVIALIRNIIIVFKEKKKFLQSYFVLVLFILIYVFAGIFTYTDIWSIFPIFAAVIYMIAVWNGDELTVKKTAFACYFLWLIYNIFVYSIAGIVSNIVSIISTFIAIRNASFKEKTEND